MEDNEPEESSPSPQARSGFWELRHVQGRLAWHVQEPIEKEEDPDDILIIANPDDGQDSPKRIKSVSGNWEMFEDGAHVEYWSATHAQWQLVRQSDSFPNFFV